ncbi:MAG: triose-phosphate isomerase family protein, partial [Planctomycetota bacterium]
MPRKLFIAGNWKMNTTLSDAKSLALQLNEKIGEVEQIDLCVAPPFPYVAPVAEVLAKSRITVGAQNMFYESGGAYTGEVSAEMLKDIGASYVILGHSERRHVIGETDELINRKILK